MRKDIVFFAIMCVLQTIQMCLYIPRKLKGKNTAYTVTKCLGSALFLITAAGSLFFHTADSFTWLIGLALVLSAIGDYYLSMPSGHHRLKLGAASFVCAHLFFVAAFISQAGIHWQTLAFALIPLALEFTAAKLIKLNFRGAEKPVAAYLSVVTIMACFAVSTIFFTDMSRTSVYMTAAGGVLFLISDMLWVLYGLDRNSSKNLVKALNVLTYFPAQLLIAGALIFR